jgi:predicted branched-subunit amino acid permease
MKSQSFFKMGFKEMLPITTGVIPFGAIVGTICSDAQFSFVQTLGMNVLVYAGASQLAADELMTKQAASIVVVVTGLIINLRFLLYSAALSPVVQRSSFLVKLVSAYMLTDQSYAVMSANQDKLPTNKDAIEFYFGASMCMMLVWHTSTVAGYIFGNFAPASLALDFAVPLSFVALVIPTLKNKNFVLVALFSSLASILLHSLPYKTGLIVTSGLAIALAAFLTRKRTTI